MVALREHMSKTSRSKLRWWVAISVVALVATIDPSAAQRPRARVDREVQASEGKGRKIRVIVRTAARERKLLKDTFSRKSNHKIRREMGMMSALSLELPDNAIDAMARTPGVLSVSIDAPLQGQHAVMPITGTLLKQTLGMPSVNGQTGAGVGVAVIDSGIAPSPDFGNRITAFYDFTQGGIATQPYYSYARAQMPTCACKRA